MCFSELEPACDMIRVVFDVYFLVIAASLVVSIIAINCPERLVSVMRLLRVKRHDTLHSLTHSTFFYPDAASTAYGKLLVICQNPVSQLPFTVAVCVQIITPSAEQRTHQ